MYVSQAVEAALSDIVDGNIWPLSCPTEAKPLEFITYTIEDTAREYADDDDQSWLHEVEANWFGKPSDGRYAVDYTTARTAIRKALKSAGFSVTNIIPGYESDTGYTHLIVMANILEEYPESEEDEDGEL